MIPTMAGTVPMSIPVTGTTGTYYGGYGTSTVTGKRTPLNFRIDNNLIYKDRPIEEHIKENVEKINGE